MNYLQSYNKYKSEINTPIGTMLAISDNKYLYLLKFFNQDDLENSNKQLKDKKEITTIEYPKHPITIVKRELDLYFAGKLKSFTTPIRMIGKSFQEKTWRILINIPYGHTISYKDQAQTMGNEKLFRAVANANSANSLAIIVPCHRVINHNGQLGGYNGGRNRKKWLIEHENKYV